MNTRRNSGRRFKKDVVRGNKDSPHAPSIGVQVPFNPVVLTDGEVREALVKIAQATTTQAKAITTQSISEGALLENPHARTMARRLRDFARMRPLVYYGSKTNEDLNSLWMWFVRLSMLWALKKRKTLSLLLTNLNLWLKCCIGCGEKHKEKFPLLGTFVRLHS